MLSNLNIECQNKNSEIKTQDKLRHLDLFSTREYFTCGEWTDYGNSSKKTLFHDPVKPFSD